MRRDARVRRDALIDAAAAAFLHGGYLVPLEEIAERAGVGRGTLYRNFRDRMALVIAVFDRELTRLQAMLDPAWSLEEAIAALVMAAAPTAALFNRLSADLPFDDDHRCAFEALATRLAAMLAPAVARAHADGSLRPAVGPREAVLVMRMIGGLLRPHQSPAEMTAILAVVMPLLADGLRPRDQ